MIDDTGVHVTPFQPEERAAGEIRAPAAIPA
jgi:glutamine amidotransferase